jgi:hypothetical protein
VANRGHAEHSAAAVREKVLPLHLSHAPSPAVLLDVPAAHATHVPLTRVYPLLHTHAVDTLTSLSSHVTIAPSFIEMGRVVRSTFCSMAGVTKLDWFTTRAKSAADVARMITSAL